MSRFTSVSYPKRLGLNSKGEPQIEVQIGGLWIAREQVNFLREAVDTVPELPLKPPQTFSAWAREQLTKDGHWKCPTGFALRCAKRSLRQNDQAGRIRNKILGDHQPMPARWVRRWNDRVQANWKKLQAKLGLPA